MTAEAQKQFIISFQSAATVDQTKRTSFAIEIMQDADAKCTELGKLELPGQTKDLDPKYQATLRTSATSQADFDSGVSFIVNCLVEVSIR